MDTTSELQQMHEAEENILNTNPFHKADFFWENHKFTRDGYLKITHLVDPVIMKAITRDTLYLLENFSKRRDIFIESTGNTPRYLSNVIRDDIKNEGKFIPNAYNSLYLKGLIEGITREEIIPTPWKWDNYIINCQHKSGDTHGWHWGDYPYTLIWVIKAPDVNAGGLLECVPHTTWDKKNPRIQELLLHNKIDSYHHSSGDVYILKADTTLHRVKPLTVDTTRIILNTTWERARDELREVEHETFVFRD